MQPGAARSAAGRSAHTPSSKAAPGLGDGPLDLGERRGRRPRRRRSRRPGSRPRSVVALDPAPGDVGPAGVDQLGAGITVSPVGVDVERHSTYTVRSPLLASDRLGACRRRRRRSGARSGRPRRPRRRPLAVAGPARELEVALEHLRHAVHPAVAERAAAGQRGQRAGRVAVDAAVGDEPVGLADRAEARAPRARTRRTARTRRRAAAGRPRRGRRRRAPTAGAPSLVPTSWMSSSGQCSGRRCRLGCAAGVAGDVHRPVRQVAGPLGGGEHERGDAVDGDVAVEPADRVGDQRRGEVLVDGRAAGRASTTRACGRRSCGPRPPPRPAPRASRRSAGGTRWPAGRSSPAGRRSPAASSTGPAPRGLGASTLPW